MNINGPSLRIVTPLPADTTPQRLEPGDGTAAPLALDNPVLAELAALRNGQTTVQNLLQDLGALRANLFTELDLLANQKGMPPQQRSALKDRVDQQFEQAVRLVENMSKHEDLNGQSMSAAIAQLVNVISTMAADLGAMRSLRSGGKIA